MLSNKPSIQHLVDLCFRKGLRKVVISPGSRNAPINISFHGHGGFDCQTITDERVAGFIGLGLGMQTGKPAILICTSGTAALNYAPAIAEAYYQKVPLLVLTADRPEEYVDQGIGQTIRQQEVYKNYIKSSYHLNEDTEIVIAESNLLMNNCLMIEQAIDETMDWDQGPVHINIPLREPLYEVVPHMSSAPYDFNDRVEKLKSERIIDQRLINIWNISNKKLIIVGQSKRREELNEILNKLSQRSDTIILTETTSHVYVDDFIQHIDRVIDSIQLGKIMDFYPDLILSIGGAVVSKKIKILLRNARAANHWHIGMTNHFPDTYGSLSEKVQQDEVVFFNELISSISESSYEYSRPWLDLNQLVLEGHTQYIKECPWSDMAVFAYIMPNLLSNTVLHLSNSTPIRYVQLFDYRQDLTYCANRGVGGIDGCTSTAIGSAMASEDRHVLITGDLSFFYDSNGLWIPTYPDNLKIIVINNGGGNIFRIIPGPESTQILDQVFEAHHDAKVKSIAEAFGLKHISVDSYNELEEVLISFLNDDNFNILEIITPRFENDRVLKNYFSFLKKSIDQYA